MLILNRALSRRYEPQGGNDINKPNAKEGTYLLYIINILISIISMIIIMIINIIRSKAKASCVR